VVNIHTILCSFLTVNASQAGAGNLEIIVSVSGHNVPNYVQSEGNAKFRVNFKPQEAAPHSLSVRFNGEPVPGMYQLIFLNPLTARLLPSEVKCIAVLLFHFT
jgi:filamin